MGDSIVYVLGAYGLWATRILIPQSIGNGMRMSDPEALKNILLEIYQFMISFLFSSK